MKRAILAHTFVLVATWPPAVAQEPIPAASVAATEALFRTVRDGDLRAALEAYRGTDAAERPDADAIDREARRLAGAGHRGDALMLHRFNALADPGSADASARLARAYEDNGQLLWARASYAIAGELALDDRGRRSRAEDRDRVDAAWAADARPEDSKGNAGRRRRVARILDVAPGSVVADVGCGSGRLSKAVAESVRPGGTVYAVEIRKAPVDKLREQAVPNVEPVLSLPEDVSLPDDSCDVVFLHDVASHVDEKVRPQLYASIARALRPDGVLVTFKHHGKAKQHLEELRGFGFVPEPGGETLDGLSKQDLDARALEGIRFRYRKTRDL